MADLSPAEILLDSLVPAKYPTHQEIMLKLFERWA